MQAQLLTFDSGQPPLLPVTKRRLNLISSAHRIAASPHSQSHLDHSHSHSSLNTRSFLNLNLLRLSPASPPKDINPASTMPAQVFSTPTSLYCNLSTQARVPLCQGHHGAQKTSSALHHLSSCPGTPSAALGLLPAPVPAPPKPLGLVHPET